jgi:hypothetical protein
MRRRHFEEDEDEVEELPRRRSVVQRIEEVEEEELPRRRRVVDDDYELDIIKEDDEWADPYLRAVNAQRRKRDGLSPGRDLHYDERQVAYMLDGIAEYRAKADALSRKLADYVANDRNLRVRYERFIATGGITGNDFRALIEKGAHPPLIKRRGPLRLVVSNRPAKRNIPRRRFGQTQQKERLNDEKQHLLRERRN